VATGPNAGNNYGGGGGGSGAYPANGGVGSNGVIVFEY